MAERNWSDKQKAVFIDVRDGTGHTVVDAVAGSGKTTTIVEAMRFVPRGCSCLFVAFNKSIANELKTRTPAGVTVSTLHAHGLVAVSKHFYPNRAQVVAEKGLGVAEAVGNPDRDPELREWVVSLAKAASLSKAFLAHTEPEIENVIDDYQIVPSDDAKDRPRFVSQVKQCLDFSAEFVAERKSSTIDFDDMVWLPTRIGLGVRQFDRVFVDETQDLNLAQIQLALRSVRPGGRICAVGDPRQAIYQFAGAADDSFGRVRKALEANRLELSVTFRCAKAVVREAQKMVPHLEAAADAEEGICEPCGMRRMFREAREGDFVLSRTNAPLLKLCLAFLKEGRRANIQGRDIGGKLAAMLRRAKTNDLSKALTYLDKWHKDEIKRLEEREKDTTSVLDTYECICALADGESTVNAVFVKIERLFADGDETSRITLSTTHKAKGLERDRVWLLRDTYLRPPPGTKSEGYIEPSLAEKNLYYVACTRARRALYLVRDES